MLRQQQLAGRADGGSVDASMMAHLVGYIGADERKRAPLGASCVDNGASELTRRLNVDSGSVSEARSTSLGRELTVVLTIASPVAEG